eukprot:COSAG01_NODE_4644_length_4854_cov_2.999579_2_plen_86_part_00
MTRASRAIEYEGLLTGALLRAGRISESATAYVVTVCAGMVRHKGWQREYREHNSFVIVPVIPRGGAVIAGFIEWIRWIATTKDKS